MYRYNVQVFTILLYATREVGINELLLITKIIAIVTAKPQGTCKG